MSSFSVRQLDATSEQDRRDVQSVHEGAAAFIQLVEGQPPAPTAAEELFAALPPGKTHGDKFVFGFYLDEQPIGCADVIRGYPEQEVAFIGLLVFVEAVQGRGFGPTALQEIYRIAASWGCRRIRLAVVDVNTRAFAFWQREGFTELFRKNAPGFVSEAIVMERVNSAT
jgi:diamine N-acetyltransferase